jgi:acetyl-CoA carboxylase biotin carboxyl carrier protein
MEDAFMEGIDQDDVIQILRMLEESTFDELHLEMGGLKLAVSKSGKKARPLEGVTPEDGESTESKATVKPTARSGEEKAEIQRLPDQEDEGFIAIKAPMLGTFYRAPKPGAPPFVEVGRRVSADDSVCIIEVMKLFNTVKANVRGRIAKICAENGQMVEYQQTLFLVEDVDGAADTAEEETAS